MKNVSFVLAISLLFLTASAFGQQNQNSNTNTDATSISLRHSLEFENDSRKDEITLSIPEGTVDMDLRVWCEITSGTLDIELYDPQDKKEANFSLTAQKRSQQKAEAYGNISKKLRDPHPGEWKLKIIPANVTGEINITANYKQ